MAETYMSPFFVVKHLKQHPTPPLFDKLVGCLSMGTLLQDYSISFVVIQRVQIFVNKKFTNVFSKLESPSFGVEVIRSFYFQCC